MESQQKLLKDLQEYHNKTQKVIIEEAEKKMVQSRGKVRQQEEDDANEDMQKTDKWDAMWKKSELKAFQEQFDLTTLTERGTNSTNSDAMVRFKNKDYQTALQTPTDGKLWNRPQLLHLLTGLILALIFLHLFPLHP